MTHAVEVAGVESVMPASMNDFQDFDPKRHEQAIHDFIGELLTTKDFLASAMAFSTRALYSGIWAALKINEGFVVASWGAVLLKGGEITAVRDDGRELLEFGPVALAWGESWLKESICATAFRGNNSLMKRAAPGPSTSGWTEPVSGKNMATHYLACDLGAEDRAA